MSLFACRMDNRYFGGKLTGYNSLMLNSRMNQYKLYKSIIIKASIIKI